MATRSCNIEIDRESGPALSEQIVKAFQGEILCGGIPFGERVPSIRRMSEILKVSVKTVKTAYAHLALEGWLHNVPRIGFMAKTPDVPLLKGGVLVVLVDAGYYNITVAVQIQRKFEEQGLCVSYVVLTRDEAGNYDYHSLDIALARSPDIVFSFSSCDDVIDRIVYAERRYVFIVHGNEACRNDRLCLGTVRISDKLAAEGLVRAFENLGESAEVWCVSFASDHDAIVRALKHNFGAVVNIKVRCDWAQGRNEAIRHAAYVEFLRRMNEVRTGRTAMPSAIVFLDDYLAQGAFLAFSAIGKCVPQTVRVVVWVNSGNSIVFDDMFERLVMDPRSHGLAVADFLFDSLSGKGRRKSLTLGPVYATKNGNRATEIVRLSGPRKVAKGCDLAKSGVMAV